jgi:hypothetical protein
MARRPVGTAGGNGAMYLQRLADARRLEASHISRRPTVALLNVKPSSNVTECVFHTGPVCRTADKASGAYRLRMANSDIGRI